MTDQNYNNHSRMVPLYHYATSVALVIPLIVSVINFIKAVNVGSGRVNAGAAVSLIVAIVLIYWFARTFALKAQDRAIRAEENFRHYLATGKPFDNRLRMGQIIALRFASDEEFTTLVQKAIAENLSPKEIKQAIKNWKADHHRV